jgi:hypothetical protein
MDDILAQCHRKGRTFGARWLIAAPRMLNSPL